MLISPEQAMETSLQEAYKGLGAVSPNPPVGCVIVDKNHKFLAKAYHKKFGGPHAEVLAINKVKDKSRLKGASIYVTLEPCAHFGKTPPCSPLLARYKLKSLFYGLKDPNPKTFGKGLRILKAKNIVTKKYSSYGEELKRLYEPFSFLMKHQAPYVSLKIASTLDGMIAFKDKGGESITGKSSKDYLAFLRACHDAVLIGAQTFLTDNPRLNSRQSSLFKNKINSVIILDPEGKTINKIEKSHLAKLRPLSRIIVVVSSRTKVKKTPFVVKKQAYTSKNFF